MCSTRSAYAAAIGLLGGAAALRAQAPAREVRVPTFEAVPVIDGVLDEPMWQAAARLERFVQTQPGDNTAPSRATSVLVGIDAHALYLGIVATDDSAQVRATIAPRDAILADDIVSIYLDTFGDRRRAYVLTFNPLGIQQDGMFAEGAAEPDYSVDVVMRSRGRVQAAGWAVEVAVPLSSLRYAAAPGQRWNVQVQRRIRHLNDELDSWMPIVRGETRFLAQAGTLVGLDALPVRRSLELIPTVTTLSAGTRVPGAGAGDPPPDGFSEEPLRTDVGLSARIGIAPDVSADIALNPDFAQVESDAPVVTANQRFPIQFPEKRPFFLEGADLFGTPLSVVHTRAIVDPIGAVKLTGKRGRTSFGVLLASDEGPGAFSDVERRDSSLQSTIARIGGRNSTVGILRLRRDLGVTSYLGMLGTAYHFLDCDNLTASVDFRVAPSARADATMQLTATWARRAFYDPGTDRDVLRTGQAMGYSVLVRRSGRHLNLTLTGKGRSPDYVTEVGFTPQVNTNVWSFETRWNAEPHPDATLIAWSAAHTVLAQFDWKGRITYGYLWPRATFTWPRLTSFTIGPYVDYQRLFEEEFRRAFAGAGVRRTVYRGFAITGATTPFRRWTLEESLDWTWDAFDYDFGGGPKFPRVSPAALADPTAPLDPGPGNTFDATVSLAWRPTAALRVNAQYTKSRLRRTDTRRTAFDENLWTLQTVYQLSHDAFLRVRGDYRSSLSNLRPQFLLAWTPHPGTALYAGYDDDLNHDGYSPITGAPEPGFHRNARSVFVKLSYLIRPAIRVRSRLFPA
jgi:hypothetical protein